MLLYDNNHIRTHIITIIYCHNGFLWLISIFMFEITSTKVHVEYRDLCLCCPNVTAETHQNSFHNIYLFICFPCVKRKLCRFYVVRVVVFNIHISGT